MNEEEMSSPLRNASDDICQISASGTSDNVAAIPDACAGTSVMAPESNSVAENICSELPTSAETAESAHQTSASATDELASFDYEVKPEMEILSGPQRNADERWQSKLVTFNLPLEVIGACWFMKRDTETRLQATTLNDEKINIRLTKKDSRVTMSFEAVDGQSVFVDDDNRCHCHIEALLEPARRPTSVSTSTTSAANASGQRRVDRSSARVHSTSAAQLSQAGSLIHGIASRLRARTSAAVNYRDNDDDDDTDVADAGGRIEDDDSSVENDAACLDEDEEDDDLEVHDNDGDESFSGKGQTFSEFYENGQSYDDGNTGTVGTKAKTSAAVANVGMDDGVDKGSSFSESDSEDGDWNPHKPLHAQMKRTRQPMCLKFRLKTDPSLDSELNAIQNDDNVAAQHESKPPVAVVGNKRGRKPKSVLKKLKHSKKSRMHSGHRSGLQSVRAKTGLKWEKKGVCPHCGVFYGNLGQHVGLYCPKNPNRQRAYHCCYCKFRSIDRASLVEHKATHVLKRDFKCEICDSAFFTRQRLVRHMRYVHLLGTNPVRIYTCDRCGKRFRYHSHYDRHLTIHSEEKTAQCDQCGKFFKNSHNVRNHQSRMHPGKPEQFPYHCSKCGQGTHSLTAHRCIVPGEMHGSRRRRAPRNVIVPPPSSVSASAAAAGGSAASTSPPTGAPMSPLQRHNDQPSESIQMSTDGRSGQAVDCSSVARTMPSDPRPSSHQPLDCNVASAGLVDQPQSDMTHMVNVPSSSNSSAPHCDAHYSPTPTSTQLFDRHGGLFDHLSTTPLLDRHQMAGGIARTPYHPHHHPGQSLPPSELPYDRRMGAAFQSQQPAVAHQPPHQPPYSNLFAVDPLLQLRAANMMYRVDY